MANWYDITEVARKEGYSTKVRPSLFGTELVCTRENEGAPGEEVKVFLVLGIAARAEEVIAELKEKQS
jgi:hypothetical protein